MTKKNIEPSKSQTPRASRVSSVATTRNRRKDEAKSALLSRPGFLIRRLHQIHCALFAEETADTGITPVQYSLLSTLKEHGELDQNSLAHFIGLERTSVAEVLPRLETRSLIVRRRSEEDGRVRLVKLTDQGEDLVVAMQPAVLRAHKRTIEALSASEQKELVRMMGVLVTADTSKRAPLLKQHL